jgi:hypothetical protein
MGMPYGAIKLPLFRAYRDEPAQATPLSRTTNEVIGFEYVKIICVSRHARVKKEMTPRANRQ